LEECNNDIEQSKVWLKKKGFKEAENKKSRLTNVKLLGLKTNSERNKLAICSVSCETEFVANTDYFKDFSNVLLNTILDQNRVIQENDYSQLPLSSENCEYYRGSNISEGLKIVIAKTQENCNITSSDYLSINSNECVGVYLHNSPAENLGVKGSYIILKADSTLNPEQSRKMTELANNLAMHIVAANSKYLRSSDVPQEVLEREKAILEEQSKNIAQNKDFTKILKNKIEKWIEENVLLEQIYLILDHEESSKPKKVSEVIKSFSNENQIQNLEIKEFKLIL
jgi:elongation factor Ts